MQEHKSERSTRSTFPIGGYHGARAAEKHARLDRVVELVRSGTPYFDAMTAVGYSRHTATNVSWRARRGDAAYARLLDIVDALPRVRSPEEFARTAGARSTAKANARLDRVIERVKAGTPVRDALVAEGYARKRIDTVLSNIRHARLDSPLARLRPFVAAPLSKHEASRTAHDSKRDRSSAKIRRVIERVKAGEAYVDAMLAEGYTRNGARGSIFRARSGDALYAPLLALGPALTMRWSKPSRPSAAPAADDVAPEAAMNKGTQRLNSKLDRLIDLVEHGCTFNAAAAALGYDSSTTSTLRYRARRGVAPYTMLLPYIGEGRETNTARLERAIELVESGTPVRDALVAEGYSPNTVNHLISAARYVSETSPLARLRPFVAAPLSAREAGRLATCARADRAQAKIRRVVERVKAGETYLDAMLAEGYMRTSAKKALYNARSGSSVHAPLLALGPALTMRRDGRPRTAATSSPVQPSLFEAPPKLAAAPAANDTAPVDDETLAALELLLAL